MDVDEVRRRRVDERAERFGPPSGRDGRRETFGRDRAGETPAHANQARRTPIPRASLGGVEKIGNGLHVEAISEDGVIEAISIPGKRFIVGTQWHPEGDWYLNGADPLGIYVHGSANDENNENNENNENDEEPASA